MINTRSTIFKTLKYRLRELTKHANLAPQDFKKIMIAVILNDLKEWSEYIPKDDPNMIVNKLEDYLMDKCFILDRMPSDHSAYVNVNTPQTNATWQRVWDNPFSTTVEAEPLERTDYSWEADPNCEIKMVYFYKTELDSTAIAYLSRQYGEHGEKLLTVCDKMDVFIDRETGKGYYLDTNGEWKPIGGDIVGVTEEEVKDLIIRSKPEYEWSTEDITTTITPEETDRNILNLATEDDLEEIV